MEPSFSKQSTNSSLQDSLVEDANSPFSFLEWKNRYPALLEKNSSLQYNSYVLSWFKRNKDKPVSRKFVLRQKYLQLLDQLQLFFTSEEKNLWYSQVNLAEEKELLLAIPYFARKLKDIALYYVKLRKQLSRVKQQYNTTGTAASLEQQIYNYILASFSEQNNELSVEMYSTVPVFSSLQQKLAVTIEELYDDHQYFDLSPTKPVSAYFDLTNKTTQSFLNTKGIVLSSSEWLFKSFDIPVTDNFDALFSSLTGNIFESTNTDTYESFIQKYLGQTKQTITFTAATSATTIYEIDISENNNYFFYPYGTSETKFTQNEQIPIVALSTVPFETFLGADGETSPTAGSSLQDSDVMFVKTGDETKAAWLRYQQYKETSVLMKAAMKKDSSTSFIFPFPGYGLSGNNFPWTGSSLESVAEYNFLSREYRGAVDEAYWSQELLLDSCNSVLVNNTTLAENGSNASTHPLHADQIFIRTDRTTDTTVPFREPVGAWLFKFLKTSLPVSLLGDNIFLWPYCVIDMAEAFPAHLSDINFNEVCAPISLKELPSSYFIAASSFDLADKIYKLNNYADAENDAAECAWLSGSLIQANGYGYIAQDGFSALFAPGEAARFIWTGPESTLREIFEPVSHRADCAFLTSSSKLSALNWQNCTCKQVYHTPFGHPYDFFEQGNNQADCIIKVSTQDLLDFDFSSWRDLSGNSIATSLDFAWYKTNNNIGWEEGTWVSNETTEEPFTLKTGGVYFYRRAKNRIDEEGFPSYTVNRSFGTSRTKWIAAKKDPEEAEWVEGPNVSSSMIIYPGDFIKVARQPETTSYLISSYETENTTPANINSVWATYDYIPVICGSPVSTFITWPSQEDPYDGKKAQYPSTRLDQVSSIYGWTITRDQDGHSESLYGVPNVTFVPPTTGTYSISVTANVTGPSPSLSTITCSYATSGAHILFAQSRDLDKNLTINILGSSVEITFNAAEIPGLVPLVISTIIPKITAVVSYTKEQELFEFQTPSSGFVLEHTLKGWNYNLNKPDTKSKGARPYWATIYVEKDYNTRYKGVYSWGYPDEFVDEYIPNNNPVVSPLEIFYGNTIEYNRKGYSFSWVQPITYKEYVNTTQWCQISADTTKVSNLSSFYSTKQKIEPIAIPTSIPTDITLSNIINGSPVEIFYHALNSFVWPVSVVTSVITETPSAEPYYVSDAPWENLQNRFFPTIANIPVLEDTYSAQDIGGYFLPQHLGASLFVNKEFDVFLSTEDLSGTFLTEDTSLHVGGRGRTNEDQTTIYDWTENNQWLKESVTTGDLAGAIKRDVTKTRQTFIPYQSNSDETALGLVTNQSRVSPWGGYRDEEWTDLKNDPKSYTGVRNVSAWAASQIIKQTDKPIEQWSSDIYGNQYGLFKQLSGVSSADHVNVTGQLWTKTNEQIVKPGYVSLSAVFEPFKYDATVYSQLTGTGIKSFQCYFDTIFIETNDIVIFAKIEYDYDTGKIECIFDDTRYKYKTKNLKFNQNWFFSADKKIITLYTQVTGTKFYPSLYEIDLQNRNETKIYPVTKTAVRDLSSSLDEIHIKQLKNTSLFYSSTQDAFLITYTGTDLNNSLFILDFTIKYEEPLTLSRIDYYTDLYDSTVINEPPIVLSPYLTAINVNANNFSVPVVALNSPTQCVLLTHSTQITAISSTDGQFNFVGQVDPGLHHVNYSIINSVGNMRYCLTLSAI